MANRHARLLGGSLVGLGSGQLPRRHRGLRYRIHPDAPRDAGALDRIRGQRGKRRGDRRERDRHRRHSRRHVCHSVNGNMLFSDLVALLLDTNLESGRSYNAGAHTATLTYYRRNSGAKTANLLSPILVKVTAYDATDTQPQNQSVGTPNLPSGH